MNSRNIIFSFCVCVVLCLCLGHNVVRAVGGLSDDSARSYLEGRTYQTFPELAVGTLADGSFQSKFEQYIADLIPMRDDVMLLNAGLQRTTIALADAPFGLTCVMTLPNTFTPGVGRPWPPFAPRMPRDALPRRTQAPTDGQ